MHDFFKRRLEENGLFESANRILKTYPAPISLQFARMLEHPADAGSSFHSGLLPSLLRFIALVLTADLLRIGATDRHALQALDAVFNPRKPDHDGTEGEWAEVISHLLSSLASRQDEVFSAAILQDLSETKRSGPFLYELEALKQWRNRYVHKTQPTQAERERNVAALVAQTTRFLTSQGWLSTHRLWAGTTATTVAIDLQGAVWPITADEPLDTFMLAPGKNESLCLGPFVIVAPCDTCAELGHGNGEVFIYGRFDLGRHLQTWRGIYHDRSTGSIELSGDVRRRYNSARARSGDSPLDRVAKVTRKSIEKLANAGDERYDPNLFVEPPGWRGTLQAFLESDRNLLVLTAPTGSGKTTLLCKTACDLVEAGHATLYWHKATYESGDLGPNLKRLFGPYDVKDLFDSFHEGVDNRWQFVLLLDGLNEGGQWPSRFRSILQVARHWRKSGLLQCRIVVGVRDTALRDLMGTLQEHSELCFSVAAESHLPTEREPTVRLEPFREHQVETQFERYQQKFGFQGVYRDLPLPARTLLSQPLMLRLLGTAYPNQPLPTDLSELDLINAAVHARTNRRGDTEGERMRRLLAIVGEVMYDRAKPSVEKLDVQAAARRSLDDRDVPRLLRDTIVEGFLTERPPEERFGEPCVGFTFERFLEYQLAKHVSAARDPELRYDDKALLKELFGKASQLPVTGAATIWLRRLLADSPERAANVVLLGLTHWPEFVASIVADLLAEFERSRKTADAERLYSIVDSHSAVNRVLVLDALRTRLLQRADPHRLKALGERLIRCCREAGDTRRESQALRWLGDVYYNRLDDYKMAVTAHEEAIARLEAISDSSEHDTIALHEARYELSRVLADRGDGVPDELIEQAISFFEGLVADGRGESAERSLAKFRFLRYMVVGDNAGRFHAAIEDLTTALKIFEALGNRWEAARLKVNLAIAKMTIGTLEDARVAADEAVGACEATDDLQGRAYALLGLSALCVQRLHELPGSQQESCRRRASQALDEVERICGITGEQYLKEMANANRAVLAFRQGDKDAGSDLLQMVAKSSDFFNAFDAKVLIASLITRDTEWLTQLLAQAREHEYEQGTLHVLWHLQRVAAELGDEIAATNWRAQALAVAESLGWGTDPQVVWYQGFYAGLYL